MQIHGTVQGHHKSLNHVAIGDHTPEPLPQAKPWVEPRAVQNGSRPPVLESVGVQGLIGQAFALGGLVQSSSCWV